MTIHTTQKWNRVKLGDVATINMGQSPQSEFYNFNKEGLPFFQGVTEFGEMFPITKQWTSKITKTADSGDILFSVRAPVGRINYAREKICIGRGLASMRAKGEYLNQSYLFYVLKSEERNFILQSSGAIYDSINKDGLSDFSIKIPALSTQEQIASILSAYDNFIENNTRRIQILEQMAQAIYKEWFVDFRFPGHEKVKLVDSGTDFGKIPQEWEVNKLKRIAEVISGYAFKSSDFGKVGIPVIKIKNIISDSMISIQDADKINKDILTDKLSKFILSYGDMVVAMTGATAGKVGRIASKEILALNQRVAKIQPKEGYYSFVWGRIGTEETKNELFRLADGAAQPNMSGGQIENIPVLVPSNTIVRKYEKVCYPMLSQILIMQQINEGLSKSRDLLIPKLVTGQIEVAQEVTKPIAVKVNPYKEAVVFSSIVKAWVEQRHTNPSRFEMAKTNYFFERLSGIAPQENYAQYAHGPYNPRSRYRGAESIATNKRYVTVINGTKFGVGPKIQEALKFGYKGLNKLTPVFNFINGKSNDDLEALSAIDYAIYDLVQNTSKRVAPLDVRNYISSKETWQDKIDRLNLTEEKIGKYMTTLKDLASTQGMKYPKI